MFYSEDGPTLFDDPHQNIEILFEIRHDFLVLYEIVVELAEVLQMIRSALAFKIKGTDEQYPFSSKPILEKLASDAKLISESEAELNCKIEKASGWLNVPNWKKLLEISNTSLPPYVGGHARLVATAHEYVLYLASKIESQLFKAQFETAENEWVSLEARLCSLPLEDLMSVHLQVEGTWSQVGFIVELDLENRIREECRNAANWVLRIPPSLIGHIPTYDDLDDGSMGDDNYLSNSKTEITAATSSSIQGTHPHWDPETRTLSHGEAIIRFRSDAESPIEVLNAFEAAGWPTNGVTAHKIASDQLQNIVKRLNKRTRKAASTLRFHANGNGTGFRYSLDSTECTE